MIIQEIVDEVFIKSYSDKRVKIHGGSPEGDYDEAIDPIDAGRTYIETNIPIDEEDDPTVGENIDKETDLDDANDLKLDVTDEKG